MTSDIPIHLREVVVIIKEHNSRIIDWLVVSNIPDRDTGRRFESNGRACDMKSGLDNTLSSNDPSLARPAGWPVHVQCKLPGLGSTVASHLLIAAPIVGTWRRFGILRVKRTFTTPHGTIVCQFPSTSFMSDAGERLHELIALGMGSEKAMTLCLLDLSSVFQHAKSMTCPSTYSVHGNQRDV